MSGHAYGPSSDGQRRDVFRVLADVGVVEIPSGINREKHLYRKTVIIDSKRCMKDNLKNFGCENLHKSLKVTDYRFPMHNTLFDRFQMCFIRNTDGHVNMFLLDKSSTAPSVGSACLVNKRMSARSYNECIQF